tara:strand:- start:321 stop:806 length:486 start_codon:yes stop_codon:yes gene_type:complete
LELALLLAHYDHWLGCLIDILWLGSDGNELNVVVDSQNLATSLCFDVLLSNVLGLVIKETMGISGPSDAAHVDLVLLLERESSWQDLLGYCGCLGWGLLGRELGVLSVVTRFAGAGTCLRTLSGWKGRGVDETGSDAASVGCCQRGIQVGVAGAVLGEPGG